MYLNPSKSNVFKHLNTFHLPVMYLVCKYYFDQVMCIKYVNMFQSIFAIIWLTPAVLITPGAISSNKYTIKILVTTTCDINLGMLLSEYCTSKHDYYSRILFLGI